MPQSDTQLKSSSAHSLSWSPIALSTSSEQSLVHDDPKLYDIEPSTIASIASIADDENEYE
jgi:hypothetical protein